MVFLLKIITMRVQMRLVIPDLEGKQFFLVTKNFDVILDWNRSNYFALTVFYYPMKLLNSHILIRKILFVFLTFIIASCSKQPF